MRILIVDDQTLFRDALRALLQDHGHEVVAEANDCPEAVRLSEELAPDVLLLGRCEPVANVVPAIKEITVRAPGTSVIVLTEHSDDLVLYRAIAAGAKGYLTKELDGERFCALLSRVEEGGPAMTPQSASKLLQTFVESAASRIESRDAESLTDREREVLDIMARGITSNRELASTLQVSENTVRFHVRNILEKLNLHTRAAAIAFALTHGIVNVGDGT